MLGMEFKIVVASEHDAGGLANLLNKTESLSHPIEAQADKSG